MGTLWADNGTHEPCKTPLSQHVATSTAVEMGGEVHTQTQR